MNRGMASHERERERDTRERRTGDRTDRRISRPSRNSQTSVRSTTVSSGHSGVLMVGPNFRVGKKIGCGNFGELRLGEPTWVLPVLPAIYCIHTAPHHTHFTHIRSVSIHGCRLYVCMCWVSNNSCTCIHQAWEPCCSLHVTFDHPEYTPSYCFIYTCTNPYQPAITPLPRLCTYT